MWTRINFDFADFDEILASGKATGKIALVTPDGAVREVADGLASRTAWS